MRGKVSLPYFFGFDAGITPAYAGKSRSVQVLADSCGDHPRVFGEKVMTPRRYEVGGGSPPRMRGKACPHWWTPPARGITPAYAGKSIYAIKDELAGTGSPPRMRGKDSRRAVQRARPGITPAYAGKRIMCRTVCGVLRDHPRVCGEKPVFPIQCADRKGSPPRMRGKADLPLFA